ncbi:HET-domain-containing protein [Cubamyces sp. BRFM 1775]|nr:HET-domain-containing protein [Cubamyces sp. BRFM 1775]
MRNSLHVRAFHLSGRPETLTSDCRRHRSTYGQPRPTALASHNVLDMPAKLPRKPSSVCSACWKGPLASQLGLIGPGTKGDDGKGTSPSSGMGRYTYTVSPGAILFRAALGCKWCKFLVKRLWAKELKGLWWSRMLENRPLDIITEIRPKSKGGPSMLFVGINDVSPVGATDGLCLSVYTMSDDPAAKYLSERPRLPDVGSDRTFAMARACVEKCAREHDRCRAISLFSNDPTRRAPTRLIDCSDPLHPRIIPTEGASYVYAALSYVWGEDQPYRTTEAKLSSYMTGIDPLDLPQTIRDAIHATHLLGIAFLWIDSLCIVQDSPEDKHRELASMRNVYRHAYITINAASAEKVSDGFLEDRRPLDCQLVLPVACPKDLTGQPVSAVGNLHISDNMYDTWPGLDRIWVTTGWRGWCLQEELLSTRSLVFSPWTVQLRCQTTTQNIGGAFHNNLFDVPRLPDTIFHATRIKRHSDEWVSLRLRWHGIVEEYSRRKLTYPEDKFLACAGLAEMFAVALGSNYVAGTWEDDFLLDDLLWYCRNLLRPRPTVYLAPSWSWASVDAPVTYILPLTPTTTSRLSDMAQVVGCDIVAQDESFCYGPVSGGHLVLRARLFPGRLDGSKATGGQVSLGSGSTQVPLRSYFDCSDDTDTDSEGLWAVPLQRYGPNLDSWCAGLLVQLVRSRLGSPQHTCRGAWTPVENLMTFRRVGYFEVGQTDDMRKLGWDKEWSLDSAIQFALV